MESNIFQGLKQDSRQGRGDAILMTLGYGLGMLAIGMVLILGAGIVLYLVTNNKEEEK
jgi:hypothetical protein